MNAAKLICGALGLVWLIGPAFGEGVDALVPGTKFNATGDVACTLAAFPGAAQCPFGVVRHGDGTADIEISLPDGSVRSLSFDGKAFAAGDEPIDFKWDDRGMAQIRLGDGEHYEIPDIVVYGD